MNITKEMIDAAKKAAPQFWRDTDNFEKHISKIVTAAYAALPAGVGVETAAHSSPEVGRWMPIEQADKTINHVTEFTQIGLTLKNSDTFWVRDEDGRIYLAAWSEGNNGLDYWWDWEAESPVDPVDFMPHPLDPRWASGTKGKDND